jgi:hypothetical protein
MSVTTHLRAERRDGQLQLVPESHLLPFKSSSGLLRRAVMEEARFSEKLISHYITARHHDPEDCYLKA